MRWNKWEGRVLRRKRNWSENIRICRKTPQVWERPRRISPIEIGIGSIIHKGKFSQPPRLVVFDPPHVLHQAFPTLNNLDRRSPLR